MHRKLENIMENGEMERGREGGNSYENEERRERKKIFFVVLARKTLCALIRDPILPPKAKLPKH